MRSGHGVQAEAHPGDRASVDQTRFAWYGPTGGSAAYFRVAGPTIVIEYSPQNQLTDHPAEHIHGLYRDPSNDYGVR